MALKRPFSAVAPSQDDVAPSQAEDAGDRARRLRNTGLIRVQLRKIGFWPDNRGTLGISSYHAMEVTWDCMANKIKLQRYGHVDLV